MADLIDRTALLNGDDVCRVTEYDEAGFSMRYKAVPVEAIRQAPAVDAVEVVRCKDCEKRGDPGKCPLCLLGEGDWDDYTNDNGFCDRGDRRAGDG